MQKPRQNSWALQAEKQRGFRQKKVIIKRLGGAFGALKVAQLTTKAVEQYQTSLLKQNLKPSSVNRVLATLKHMITKAVQWEMAPEEALKRVRSVKQLLSTTED
jgi:site-specific recombinase XerD